MFFINPESYSKAFAFPAEVVDRHLRLAGSAQLKVLLWLYRHSGDGVDTQELAKAVGLPRADVLDAVQYWVEYGILVESPENRDENEAENTAVSTPGSPGTEPADSGTEPADSGSAPAESGTEIAAPGSALAAPGSAPKSQKTDSLPHLPEIKPSVKQLAARQNEDPGLRELFFEAQTVLGKTLGFDTQATLLMIYDTYGLPAEVILSLLGYAGSINKANMSYVSRVAKDWAEQEIDTFEKANDKIKSLTDAEHKWKEFSRIIGNKNPTPTKKQREYIEQWTCVWGFSVEALVLAYEEMANHCATLSFPYINTVLKQWEAKGLIKTEDIKKYLDAFSAAGTVAETEADSGKKPATRRKPSEGTAKRKNADTAAAASYDLNAAVTSAAKSPIVFKKKGAVK